MDSGLIEYYFLLVALIRQPAEKDLKNQPKIQQIPLFVRNDIVQHDKHFVNRFFHEVSRKKMSTINFYKIGNLVLSQ